MFTGFRRFSESIGTATVKARYARNVPQKPSHEKNRNPPIMLVPMTVKDSPAPPAKAAAKPADSAKPAEKK